MGCCTVSIVYSIFLFYHFSFKRNDDSKLQFEKETLVGFDFVYHAKGMTMFVSLMFFVSDFILLRLHDSGLVSQQNHTNEKVKSGYLIPR